MTMLAEVVGVAVGGDTHRDSHCLEMVTPAGVTISTITVGNDEAGFAAVIGWIAEHAPAGWTVVGLEGTRSYGIGLTRALLAAGLDVVEVTRSRRIHNRKGKSDPLDARAAALAVLQMPVEALIVPRRDGLRHALAILLSARDELTTTRTMQINRLRALLLTGDDTDRDLARGQLSKTRLAAIAARPAPPNELLCDQIRREELHRLATAIAAADIADRANHHQLTEIVRALTPELLDTHGIGPVSAAQLIVSFSHPGRCRNEAAFAALAGVNPIPASSGRTIRHRVNRGGDRALNRALHIIANTRIRSCPRTRAYVARRKAEGKTEREIRRCLKRYIARETYRKLADTLA